MPNSKLVFNSIKFLYLRRIFNAVSSIIVIAIIARNISVESFGTVAIAETILAYNLALGSQTFSNYIIYYDKNKFTEILQSSFWLNLILSLLSILFFFIISGYVADFFGDEILQDVINTLLIVFFISQLNVIPNAILEKKLDFQSVALRDIMISVFSAIIGIYMALNNFGIWSLIFPKLICSPIILIITMYAANWFPKFKLYKQHWRAILHYTMPLFGQSLMTTTIKRFDSLIIGKFLGQELLGFYNVSQQSVGKFDKFLIKPLKQLFFPAFKSFGSDKKIIKEKIITTHSLIAFFSVPVYMFLLFFAEEFIFTLYSEKWSKSVIPFLILIPLFLRSSFKGPMNSMFLLFNKNNIPLRISLIQFPFIVLGFFLTYKISLEATVMAIVITKLFFGEISFYYSRKLIEYTYSEFFNSIFRYLIISIISLILPLIFSNFIDIYILRLLISLVIFIILYLVINFKFKTPELSYLQNEIYNYYKKIN